MVRLLIVDDMEIWRETLSTLFTRRGGFEVETAASGDKAVEKIQAHDYDLILMDMRMPTGTEGFDALSKIKELKPQTEVIIISAYGDIPKAVEAIKRGARDFVPKEADFHDIITFKVDEFVQRRRLLRDRELFIRGKYKEVQQAQDASKKAKALEELVAALLASIEGFIEIGRDVQTADEEIDLVLRNVSRDPSWQKESEIILVECKNWSSQRVGKNEFVTFRAKLENRYRRCKLGFLICTGAIAKTIKVGMLRSSTSDLLIVPIDGRQLRQLVEAENRSRLLRKFVDDAILT
jgi:DNA-binding NarL/FixJ family response regulator